MWNWETNLHSTNPTNNSNDSKWVSITRELGSVLKNQSSQWIREIILNDLDNFLNIDFNSLHIPYKGYYIQSWKVNLVSKNWISWEYDLLEEWDDWKFLWYDLFYNIFNKKLQIKELVFTLQHEKNTFPVTLSLSFKDKRVQNALRKIAIDNIKKYQKMINDNLLQKEKSEWVYDNVLKDPEWLDFLQACKYLSEVWDIISQEWF